MNAVLQLILTVCMVAERTSSGIFTPMFLFQEQVIGKLVVQPRTLHINCGM